MLQNVEFPSDIQAVCLTENIWDDKKNIWNIVIAMSGSNTL